VKLPETNNGETTISIDVKVDRKYFVIANMIWKADLFASDLSATFF
jgi:hypothetical protein